jgi:hypothetical protein
MHEHLLARHATRSAVRKREVDLFGQLVAIKRRYVVDILPIARSDVCGAASRLPGVAGYNHYALLLYRLGRKQDALDLLNRFRNDELRLQASTAQIKQALMRELNIPSDEGAGRPVANSAAGAVGIRSRTP